MRAFCLSIALVLCHAVLSPASAALLIKGSWSGHPFTIIADDEQGRVAVSLGTARHLVDHKSGLLYSERPDEPATRTHARHRPGHDALPGFQITAWGPGPVVAGHASIYHVLMLNENVCGEVLVSKWMLPFVESVVRALSVLEAAAVMQRDPSMLSKSCGEVHFATLAAAGWPLMAGTIDQPTMKTDVIDFDHEAKLGDLALPAAYAADQISNDRDDLARPAMAPVPR